MDENNNDPNKRRKSLSEAQIESGFGGKEARENLKTMKQLIAATQEATKAAKEESDVMDDKTFFDNLDKGFSFQGKGIESLRAEFVSLREVVQDPNISDAERDIANDTLEALKEGIETEEERREKAKQDEEANSILTQISDGTNKMADGLSDFLGNAFTAGGLLATALFIADPEMFFKILQTTIAGISEIIQSITMAIDGDFKGAIENIKENFDTLGPILGVIGAAILPSIIRAVGAVARTFQSIGGFISKLSGPGGVMQNLRGSIRVFAQGLARVLLPITAIIFAIKNLIDVSNDEGTTFTQKIKKFLKGFVTDLVDFLIVKPAKFLLSSIFKLFGRNDAADAVNNFDSKSFIGDLYDNTIGRVFNAFIGLFGEQDFQFDGISGTLATLIAMPLNLVKNVVAGLMKLIGLESAGDALQGFSFTDIFKFIGDTIFGVIDGIVDFFADLMTGEGLGGALANLGARVGNFMQDMVKAVLRFVLPNPAVDQGIIGNLAVEGLKKLGAYEFAEIDTATGERIQPPEQPALNSDVLAQTESNITEGQAASQAVSSNAVLVSQPNNSNVSSSNVSVIQETTPLDMFLGGTSALGRT